MANGKVAYHNGGGAGISAFVKRMTDLAQTSHFQLDMTGLSKFPFGSRFITEHLNLMCSETSLPGSRFSTGDDTTYHGITSKVAYRRDFSELSCTFYVDNNYDTISALESWMHYIHSPDGFDSYIGNREGLAYTRFRYPSKYQCNIYLLKFNRSYNQDSQPLGVPGQNQKITYTFIDAFPINLSSMPVSYGGGDVLKVSVDFSYKRYILDLAGATTQGTNTKPSTPQFGVDNTGLQGPSNPLGNQTNSFNYESKSNKGTNEYYNNFGDPAQDNTNFGNFFNGKRVDKGVLGAEAIA